ncbi:MAG: GNAT family N-acetyltransferase [Terracidiphilus sp.]
MDEELSLEIRQPRPTEWQACRMLLPESFRPGVSPEALLALDLKARHIAGAAVFRYGPKEILDARVHVVREYRRKGIGTRLLKRISAAASERGLGEICAWADLAHESGAEAFLLANAFSRSSCFHRVEGELLPLLTHLRSIHERLLKHNRIPSSARLVGLAEARHDELAKIYATYIAAARYFHPGYVLPLFRDPRMAVSSVLQVDGAVQGLVLGEHNAGSRVLTVHAKVVLPAYRGGWANCLLMLRSVGQAWEGGARRVRFEVQDNNSDTLKLMTRCHAEIKHSRCWFVRELQAESNSESRYEADDSL